jgi:DNA-binding XRE family transcriptional regulator
MTQAELALDAGVSRSQVSLAERGQADRLRLATILRIATLLGARAELRLTWNGEALDRLLDATHAALVESVVATLRALGWDCTVEVSFNHHRERGAIDVLGFHAPTACLVAVEVKSAVPDVQATLVTLDRKARVARAVAHDRGWAAATIARVLVVGEARTSRRRIDRHAAIFEAALPARTVEVRRWLRNPERGRPVRGIWFLSSDRVQSARHRVPDSGDKSRAWARTTRPGRATASSSFDPSAGHLPRSH